MLLYTILSVIFTLISTCFLAAIDYLPNLIPTDPKLSKKLSLSFILGILTAVVAVAAQIQGYRESDIENQKAEREKKVLNQNIGLLTTAAAKEEERAIAEEERAIEAEERAITAENLLNVQNGLLTEQKGLFNDQKDALETANKQLDSLRINSEEHKTQNGFLKTANEALSEKVSLQSDEITKLRKLIEELGGKVDRVYPEVVGRYRFPKNARVLPKQPDDKKPTHLFAPTPNGEFMFFVDGNKFYFEPSGVSPEAEYVYTLKLKNPMIDGKEITKAGMSFQFLPGGNYNNPQKTALMFDDEKREGGFHVFDYPSKGPIKEVKVGPP